MKYYRTKTLHESLAKLDRQSSNLVKQMVFDFEANPLQPGHRFHRLTKSIDDNFWSVRVNRDLRLIVHRLGDSMSLCYAGHHDDAYAWAAKRKIGVHPRTGSVQIVEVIERQEEVTKYVLHEVKQEPLLFERHDTDYLLALGVPQEWLGAVKSATQTTLYEMLDRLPEEAAERLFDLASGNPVPRPITVSGDPFLHPDAQRRFRVISGQEELQRALEAPWEKWLVFLHPIQREVVEKMYSGATRISGSAGTGKTVVAIHRAVALARRNPTAKILLTTFTKTLAERLRHQLHLLAGADAAEARQIQVKNLHSEAHAQWRRLYGRNPVIAGEDQLAEALRQAQQKLGSQYELGFLQAEWDAVIDAFQVRSWSAYENISRTGRGMRLSTNERRVLWPLFAQVQNILAAAGAITWSQLAAEAADGLARSAQGWYDHVVADEAQDFGPSELRFLRALANEGANDLFLCSDAGQQIYQHPFSLASIGIHIRGRAARLRINYRTTEELKSFAEGLLPSGKAEIDGEFESRRTISLLHGPPHEFRSFETVEDEIRGVAAWIAALLQQGFQPQDMLLLARTKELLQTRVQAALQACKIDAHYLDNDSSPQADKIAVATMHRAKGLECRAAVVLGCDGDILPKMSVLRERPDEAERRAFIEKEQNLLYVACTRARERLLVTCTGEPSTFLL